MTRLTDGLTSTPSGLPHTPRVASPTHIEAKQFARQFRRESGISYEQIAGVTGRCVSNVYDALSPTNDNRHLTYADLIAMSRHSGTKQFVAHLLEPIEQGLCSGAAGDAGAKKPGGADGKR